MGSNRLRFGALCVIASVLVGGVHADLVAHWSLDDGAGTGVQDVSGNGHDGTLAGSPKWVEGLHGGALQFGGSPDRVIVPYSPDLNPGGAFTVVVWANVEPGSSSWRSPITSRDDGPQRGYILYAGENGNWQFWIGTGSAWSNAEGPAVQMGEWTHVAGAYDSGQQTLYINGVKAGEVAGTISLNTESVLTIGAGASDVAAGDYFFVGLLDDVALFDTALSDAEIQDLMEGFTSEQATRPVPEEGATDIARDAALRWVPGVYAARHDLYLGTDFDEVNEAGLDSPTYQGRVEAATFDPGRLTLGQTYYWRVDEVNVAPDQTVFGGPVWSFTVEPVAFPVPIGAVTATASTSMPRQGAEHVVDGSGLAADDTHSDNTDHMWTSGPGDTAPWIQLSLAQPEALDRMRVWNHNSQTETFLGFGAKEVRIETSLNGTDWSELKTTILPQASGKPTYAGTDVSLDGVLARSVRMGLLSNYSLLGLAQRGLAEVRFYAVPTRARREVPADGTTDLSPRVNLAWRSGREAARHQVWLGTDPNALSLVGETDAARLTVDVELDSTLYWQVVEVNDAEEPSAWTGPLWSFRTVASRVVDDFESYRSKDGFWIWEVWSDGFDDSSNGALLGHNNGNDVATDIVHGGDQSLPYYYGQGGATVSEASVSLADLPVGRDWTSGAPTTLVLRVRGDLSNGAADRLYVNVGGTKVYFEGDLVTPIWRQWNVDLASLGIDLSAVDRLGIGVESSGSGILHVDDIALYRTAPVIVEPATGADRSLVAHWTLDETAGLTAADSSGYGHDGTLVGMDGSEWTPGLWGGALAFNGTDQYVDCGNAPSLRLAADATISAWVKMEADNQDAYMGIAGKLVANPYAGFALVRHSSNVFRLWARNVDGSGVEGVSSDETYTDTEWHHVVGVVRDNTASLYVDGAKQLAEASVGLLDSGDYAHIGKQYSNTSERYWQGLIDDVRIYYRALSAAEISGL